MLIIGKRFCQRDERKENILREIEKCRDEYLMKSKEERRKIELKSTKYI